MRCDTVSTVTTVIEKIWMDSSVLLVLCIPLRVNEEVFDFVADH